MGKYVFACTVLVESDNEVLLPKGTILSVTYRSARSVEELVKKTVGFKLKSFANSVFGWADSIRGGEREIIVSANNVIEAAAICEVVWQHFKTT